jgi:hypothetical protein
MTTIEELQSEISALKEALDIVENRAGNMVDVDLLKSYMGQIIKKLESKLHYRLMDLPVEPHEREFEKD